MFEVYKITLHTKIHLSIMTSSQIWLRVVLLRTDVSEETNRDVLRLLVTANILSSSIIVTLTMEDIRSSETSVLTRATRRHNPEDGIFHSHRHENLKFCIALTGWAL
jgi:hypothetical protein